MKKLTLILALTLASTACETRWWVGKTDYAVKPDQEEAVNLIWPFYKAEASQVPPISWMDYTDCKDAGPNGFWDGVFCVDGDMYPTEWLVLIGYARQPKLSTSALAHELAHAASWALGEGGDGYHTGRFFITNGLVDQATKLLTDKGL
jgi:hypothetical protein